MADKFEFIRDIGSGNFGVAKLMRNKVTNELVAVKFIERGERVDKNVEREIINHRMLLNANVVSFKELYLTPTHLCIVMEYAAGGELFDRIVKAGRFSEDEARYFFQQLICGVDYCHQSGVCHRDLKLENTLLDGSPAPRVKICDFGYSKSVNDSQPKSTVGTPAYIAPEVLQRTAYNGHGADVWSCGVTLYVMLVGAYPFEDHSDPRNFSKTIKRILAVKYAIPPQLHISKECEDLLSRIFVAAPAQRISLAEIKKHPWFLKNLPIELANPSLQRPPTPPTQSVQEIQQLVHMARHVGPVAPTHDTEGAIDEAMAEVLDEEFPADGDLMGGGYAGGGGAGFVV